MEIDIGIRSDIPLTAAYSDLSNRFPIGKSMAGGAGWGGGGVAGCSQESGLAKAIVLFEVTK